MTDNGELAKDLDNWRTP